MREGGIRCEHADLKNWGFCRMSKAVLQLQEQSGALTADLETKKDEIYSEYGRNGQIGVERPQ